MGTLAKSEDPDEMPHIVAFHQGLHCLLEKKSKFKERNAIYYWKILTCDPLIYIMDHSDLSGSNFMENSISQKGLI